MCVDTSDEEGHFIKPALRYIENKFYNINFTGAIPFNDDVFY